MRRANKYIHYIYGIFYTDICISSPILEANTQMVSTARRYALLSVA